MTKQLKKLYEEVKKDSEAFKKLQNKASWERKPLFKILEEQGDPRKWDE